MSEENTQEFEEKQEQEAAMNEKVVMMTVTDVLSLRLTSARRYAVSVQTKQKLTIRMQMHSAAI